MPHDLITGTPPSSKADIDPTMAKSLPHAFCVAARFPVDSVWSSYASMCTLRPQIPPMLLKYAAAASVPWNAELNSPPWTPVPS